MPVRIGNCLRSLPRVVSVELSKDENTKSVLSKDQTGYRQYWYIRVL